MKEWFGISSDADKAGMTLVHQGNVILPYYATLVEGFFTNIAEFFISTFIPTVFEIAEAQAECALCYQQKRTVDNQQYQTCLILLIMLTAVTPLQRQGSLLNYLKVNCHSLYVCFMMRIRLLKSSRGLRVWLGKKGNDYVVAYSGTDVSSVVFLM